MAVKLVALDIDGTIVDRHDHTASPTTEIREAVIALRAAGIEIVLASGRMLPGTLRIAQCLSLTAPLVCQQGASIHEPDGSIRHEFPLAMEIAREIIDYARGRGNMFEWFAPNRYISSVVNEAAEAYGRVSGITPEWNSRPEDLDLQPTGVGVISSREESTDIHRELVALYGDRLHLLDFPGVTVAMAPEANKGHAVSLVAQEMGIGRNAVVAIGDSVNDAPMLAWAGTGIAVGGADAYALDAADRELAAPGVTGVAAYLRAILEDLR